MEIKYDKPRDIDVPYDLMEKLWAYSVRRRQGRANNNREAQEFPTSFSQRAVCPTQELHHRHL